MDLHSIKINEENGRSVARTRMRERKVYVYWQIAWPKPTTGLNLDMREIETVLFLFHSGSCILKSLWNSTRSSRTLSISRARAVIKEITQSIIYQFEKIKS